MGAALTAVGIGAGADGEGTALGAGLHDGDIQPGHKAAVIRCQTDADGSVADPDVGHLRQPPAVTGGGLGPAQGVHHVPCGDAGAVAEGGGPQGDGIGIAGGVVGIRFRQGGLGLKLPVQGKQPLVQQSPQGQLGPVGAGDGVRRLPLQIRQGEGCELHVLVLILVLHVVIIRQGAENVVGVVRPVAPGQHRQAQGQQRREYALFHGIPRFHRQIMAI